jgi:ferredoxin
MRVHANQAKCVAAGTCAAVAPAVFDQNDESGIVELLDEHPPESERSAVEEAAEFCPAQAISIEED